MSATSLPGSVQERFSVLLDRLDQYATSHGRKRPRRGHGDSYTACCPAHHDRSPSLALRLEGDRILCHCFAGCDFEDVLGAVGFPPEACFGDWEPAKGAPTWRFNGGESPPDVAESLNLAEGERVPLPPTLTEFHALEFPPIEPILGPWSSQQINLLFAPTGAGKTMLGGSLAFAMAEGRDFLGWESAGPRRVLYVDAEMAARMMQERFAGAASSNLYIANLPGWWANEGGEPVNLATEEAQLLMSVWVNAIDADVVILDNFMSLAWRDGVSFASDEIWSPLRRWMIQQRAAGRCVILVDHANSQGTVFGTKTKTHICDLIGSIKPLEDDEDWEEIRGLHGAIQAPFARFTFDKTRGFSESDKRVNHREFRIGPIGDDWEWRWTTDPLLEKIRALRGKGLSLRDIAEELGVSYSKVQRRWRKVQTGDEE